MNQIDQTRWSLEGKVVLLTGASKGIGEAMAREMGRAGAHVIVSSRKQEAVEEVAQQLTKEGIKASAFACNTGSTTEMEQLIATISKEFGRLDVLVNNAATNPVFGNITEAEVRAFDKIMDVNLKGPWYLSSLASRLMKVQNSGSIINISSIEGISPSENLGIYSISKAALIMLTKVLANELGRYGIRVNAICPGYIKTKLSEMVWNDEKLLEEVMQQQAINYKAVPDDIAGIAWLLASDAGRFFTGSVITVDGGFTI
ncbi:MAG: glucose 1-dehydrogenase [Cytophagales bacterium]|nr:MAG: glucose 1-dehydrogenase [Cytophagales bacterium]